MQTSRIRVSACRMSQFDIPLFLCPPDSVSLSINQNTTPKTRQQSHARQSESSRSRMPPRTEGACCPDPWLELVLPLFPLYTVVM